MDKIVLCRRELGDIGEKPPRFCNKDITFPNTFNWCPECYSRIPFWPNDLDYPSANTPEHDPSEHAYEVVRLGYCEKCDGKQNGNAQ